MVIKDQTGEIVEVSVALLTMILLGTFCGGPIMPDIFRKAVSKPNIVYNLSTGFHRGSLFVCCFLDLFFDSK